MCGQPAVCTYFDDCDKDVFHAEGGLEYGPSSAEDWVMEGDSMRFVGTGCGRLYALTAAMAMGFTAARAYCDQEVSVVLKHKDNKTLAEFTRQYALEQHAACASSDWESLPKSTLRAELRRSYHDADLLRLANGPELRLDAEGRIACYDFTESADLELGIQLQWLRANEHKVFWQLCMGPSAPLDTVLTPLLHDGNTRLSIGETADAFLVFLFQGS